MENHRALIESFYGRVLSGTTEPDRKCLLKTLRILKANLTDPCDSAAAEQRRANHG